RVSRALAGGAVTQGDGEEGQTTVRYQYIRPTPEQRAALRERFHALLDPAEALALLQHFRPGQAEPVLATCSPAREPKDRCVIRVQTITATGERAAYALKCYVDDRGAEIQAVYRALAAYWSERGEPCPVCVPLSYIPAERLLILPWLDGLSLADAIAAGHGDFVAAAVPHLAALLAQLHQSAIVPEAPTTPEAMLEQTQAHFERLSQRWPAVALVLQPLLEALWEALPHLDPAVPVLVHGDTGPGNFFWDGERWLLLDLD